MTDDNVTFGAFHKNLDNAHKDVKKVLEAAVGCIGDDVLSEFEEDFAKESLESLERLGNRFELSEKRSAVIDRIKAKLDKEGLV